MSSLSFVKPEVISLKNHPDYNEKWVQDIIANDPSILGLGELVLLQKEVKQPKAGRLDLLFIDPKNDDRRYEVEIQLGKSDESHIIRTVEYWDIERKRYPQYDHCAVIVAENITSRFLNVISLFNRNIPLIALQMNAIKVEDKLSLIFTKVLDEFQTGFDDAEADMLIADRSYWDKKTPESMKLADQILKILNAFNKDLTLNYNKSYITLQENYLTNNFIKFFPMKTFLVMNVKYPREDEIESKLEESTLEYIKYNKRGRYKLKLRKHTISENHKLLSWFLKQAYNNSKI